MLFALTVGVEVGLDRHYVVVVVDGDGFHPRMVGAGDVDFFEPGGNGEHQRRDKDVSRARHAQSGAIGSVAERAEAFDGSQVVALDGDIGVVAAERQSAHRSRHVEHDLPVGYFTIYKSSKDYPEKLRKVVCIDPEDDTRYIFLTNNLSASEETIAEFYRNRWSVELFFKWIKQHLRIKKFWGTSENAVRIQIYCAIITYCLVAIVQHDMKLQRSIYEVLQILGISLTDKTLLRDLFDKSNFKNVNDLYDSSEPNLFNF